MLVSALAAAQPQLLRAQQKNESVWELHNHNKGRLRGALKQDVHNLSLNFISPALCLVI